MPRRNRRKRCPNEGRLGFNPEKYISRPDATNAPNASAAVHLAQKVSYEPRSSQNRHKARSLTRKKQRALEEVRRMERTAERVVISTKTPRRSSVNIHRSSDCSPQSTGRPLPQSTALPPAIPQAHHEAHPVPTHSNQTFHFFRGIKKWLKRILHGSTL